MVKNQPTNPGAEGTTRNTADRLGFWIAVLTAMLTVAAFAAGLATPPRSGPFCATACVAYPYASVAAFVPRDYRWMYLAILLTPLFAVLMSCIHSDIRESKRVFSQIALSFALISAAVITTDYFIQLEVMQPSLLKGETEGLTLFLQYNPQGIFIALEDLGYLILSASFLFASAVFSNGRGLERALQWLFLIASLSAFAAYLGMSMRYGPNLEYRFEVVVITITWTTLIVAGALLSFWFQRGVQYRS
jgi:hypothetical protein